MATGHTLTNTQARHLLDPNTLNIQGRGLSPQPSQDGYVRSSISSSRTSVSDDEHSQHSEEFTVLDGVREMNHILVKQIETLRLKIQVDEKNHNVSKERLSEEKNSTIKCKETEIEDLKDSISNRDERIQGLEKASREKEKHIQSKCDEIESLKQLVKQTEDYAKKLQKQVGKVQTQAGQLEEDGLYKQQNEEMIKLTQELELLRSRLAKMEKELQRAMNVIQQQNDKMETMTEERGFMHARFKEDLEKASKAMRMEVERMREVMRQNYEEVKNLREQNLQMSNDVREIKDMLKTKMSNTKDQAEDDPEVDGHSRQRYGQPKAPMSRGAPGMVGGNIKHTSSFRSQHNARSQDSHAYQGRRQQNLYRENTQFKTGRSSYRNVNQTRTSVSDNSLSSRGLQPNALSPPETSRSNMSPDRISRPVAGHNESSVVDLQRPYSRQNPSHPNIPSHNTREDTKNFPPICSLKEGSVLTGRHPSARSARPAVRRGSAMKK